MEMKWSGSTLNSHSMITFFFFVSFLFILSFFQALLDRLELTFPFLFFFYLGIPLPYSFPLFCFVLFRFLFFSINYGFFRGSFTYSLTHSLGGLSVGANRLSFLSFFLSFFSPNQNWRLYFLYLLNIPHPL